MATKSFVNVRYDMAKKTGVFCRISPDILDRFSQSLHHMKAPYVQMTELYFIFQLLKGRCHCNQNNVERNEKVMKAE